MKNIANKGHKKNLQQKIFVFIAPFFQHIPVVPVLLLGAVQEI